MKNILLIFAFLCLLCSCHDETIGYLITEDASYTCDSLVVKRDLDTTPPTWGTWPNPEWEELLSMGITPEELESWGISPTIEGYGGEGEDYYRVKWNWPWIGTPIEGVQGTFQIHVTIKDITTTDGDAGKLWEVLSVRGDGTFEVPLRHDVPVGRYVISLTFSNEGYTQDVDDCFAIIVK